MELDFYKPTVPQYPLSDFQDYSPSKSVKLEFLTIVIHALIQINCVQKIGSSVGIQTHDLSVVNTLLFH